jgi:hypothetical protein
VPDEFDFSDLAPQQRLVKMPPHLGGKWYYLREASEASAVAYANIKTRSARYVNGQLERIEGGADAETVLVEMNLFKTKGGSTDQVLLGSNDQPVAIEKGVVCGWPDRIVKPLFDWVKAHSKLQEDETEESISKEIARLQTKLEDLRGAKASGQPGAATDPTTGGRGTTA